MSPTPRRHLVILGGSSGIGLATARLAASRGVRVTVGGRDRTRLAAATSHVKGAASIVVDAEDHDSLAAFYRSAGAIDDLVITVTRREGGQPVEQLTSTDLLAAFAGKSAAHLRALSLALPTLAVDGSITLVTGTTAQSAQPGTALPAAVNGALESAIPPLARELAPRRVNGVSPGVIETDWWNSLGGAREQTLAAIAAQNPLGRNGRPDDVASAILALMENQYITGVVLPVDGGLRLL